MASLSTKPAALHTSLGDVTGFQKLVGDKSVQVFYGIPYAQPPVGELRFKPPVPQEPWSGTKDATQKPNSCWQEIDEAFDRFPGVEMWNPNTARSEDCLYLNVWRPSCSVGCNEPKPIMVWIYGGGFSSGTATLDVYDGSYLSAFNDVIVVSIAYRIGAMGFLFLNSPDAPGNAGLLDQALALKWVKDNAVSLGGSADDITLFGESAGAASVGFHLLSPVSRDLFTYAIMESATPLAGWAVQEHSLALKRASNFALSLNCTAGDVACLRDVRPEVISQKQWEQTSYYFDVPMGPVVDGYFLPDHPLDMIRRGDIKNTSVILGVNKNEGLYFDLYGFKEDFPLDDNGQLTETQYNNILQNIFESDETVIEKVKREYARNASISYTNRVDAISGDTLFKCPVINFAQEFSKIGGKVYLYNFEHRVSSNPWPKWLGVAHGYEIEIVFGLPLAPSSKYTDQERELSSGVMSMWTRFAQSGNPNTDGDVVWPPYTADDQRHIDIDSAGIREDRNLRRHECAFLEEL
ncbi:acetylcholinesterase-like [Physella acuta]|uniref:acetylcholinesterase-like n=1 Tax=Physella acuta TaxID=109671 RepID=UPI0027DE6CAC|nr:acetylcholinesterase-like [Physella acuta]